MAEGRRSGIYHLSGDRAVSYYGFACEIATTLGVDVARVRPVQVRSATDAAGVSNTGMLAMAEGSHHIGLEPQSSHCAIADLLESEGRA